MSYSTRLEIIRRILAEQQLDIALLFSSRNDSRFVRWATGITCLSAFHYFYVTQETAGFLEISYRAEELRGKTDLSVIPIPEENEAQTTLTSFLAPYEHVGLIGFAPFAHVSGIVSKLADVTEQIEPRMTAKSSEEIQEVGALARSLLDGMDEAGTAIVPGMSESDLEIRLNRSLIARCDSFACTASILSGPRLRIATVGKATERRIEVGDAILIDAAIVKNGLFADCTRMYFCGDSKLRACYDMLRTAVAETIDALTPGMTCGEMTERCRDRLTKNGLDASTLTVADLGHGIGFTLHEPPFVGAQRYDSTGVPDGAIFTIEPEVTADDTMIRIEEMVAFSNGRPVILTTKLG